MLQCQKGQNKGQISNVEVSKDSKKSQSVSINEYLLRIRDVPLRSKVLWQLMKHCSLGYPTAFPRRSRGTLMAVSRHFCCTFVALSQRSRSALTPLSCHSLCDIINLTSMRQWVEILEIPEWYTHEGAALKWNKSLQKIKIEKKKSCCLGDPKNC